MILLNNMPDNPQIIVTQNGNKKLIPLLIVGVIIILVIIGVFIYMRYKTSSQQTQTKVPQSSYPAAIVPKEAIPASQSGIGGPLMPSKLPKVVK